MNHIAEKLSILNQTVLECVKFSDEKKIVRKFVDAAVRVFGADYGYSWFRETADPDFRWLYKSKNTPYQPQQPRPNGTMAKAFTGKKPILIDDTQKSSSVREDARKHMRSVAVIPVTYQKKNYGTLVICYRKLHKFLEEERGLAVFIGNSAAQAITISRFYESLEQQVEERTERLQQLNRTLKREITSRKQTESQLRESESRFRTFAENIIDLFTIIQKDGTATYASPSIERVLGYLPEEFVGTNVFDMMDPGDVPRMQAVTEQLIKVPRATVRTEYRYRRKDGSWCVLESIGKNMMDDPLINGIMVNSRDITERYEAEERLRRSELRLEEAQSIAKLGSWEWNLETDEVTWSKEMFRIHGIPDRSAITLQEAFDFTHPDDQKGIDKAIQQAMKSKGSYSLYYRVRLPDGTVKYVNARGNIIRGEAGQPTFILGTVQDVTEAKLSEQQLKAYTEELEQSRSRIEQERARLDSLFQSMGEGVVATDAEGNIIAVNHQAYELIGNKHVELLGKNLFESQVLLDTKGNPLPLKSRPMYQALKFGKRFATSGLGNTYYFSREDGKKLPVGITATPIVVEGKVVGAIQVLRDVTKETEIDKVKSELISLASHQLRTPLSAINWFSETLLKGEVGKITPQQRKYLQEIFNANQKMVELVYDFLNVSRLELGTFTLKPMNLSLQDVAHGVLNELEPAIKHRQQRLSVHIEKSPKTIYADRKLVRIIIQNLLSNAVKYTPEKGKVSLDISYRKKAKDKLETSIVVSDTGIGIPKHQQEHIFSKLFRADNIKKLDTEGTGLGLYILKSFVDYCGGKVWFTSHENRGTTFYVKLPVEAEKN